MANVAFDDDELLGSLNDVVFVFKKNNRTLPVYDVLKVRHVAERAGRVVVRQGAGFVFADRGVKADDVHGGRVI